MIHLAKEYLNRNDWLVSITEIERGNKDLYTYVWNTYLSGKLSKPVRFEVVSNNGKVRTTNNKETALNYSIDMQHKNGDATIFEHTRYKAELRLYWYLWRKLNN